MDIAFKKDKFEVKVAFTGTYLWINTTHSNLSTDSLSAANNANANVWIAAGMQHTLNL